MNVQEVQADVTASIARLDAAIDLAWSMVVYINAIQHELSLRILQSALNVPSDELDAEVQRVTAKRISLEGVLK